MGNGVMAIGPQLPRPSSTLPAPLSLDCRCSGSIPPTALHCYDRGDGKWRRAPGSFLRAVERLATIRSEVGPDMGARRNRQRVPGNAQQCRGSMHSKPGFANRDIAMWSKRPWCPWRSYTCATPQYSRAVNAAAWPMRANRRSRAIARLGGCRRSGCALVEAPISSNRFRKNLAGCTGGPTIGYLPGL
jgi:hypothetical protein